jgi:hypothetical protein
LERGLDPRRSQLVRIRARRIRVRHPLHERGEASMRSETRGLKFLRPVLRVRADCAADEKRGREAGFSRLEQR